MVWNEILSMKIFELEVKLNIHYKVDVRLSDVIETETTISADMGKLG